jgi:hypothetical protein
MDSSHTISSARLLKIRNKRSWRYWNRFSDVTFVALSVLVLSLVIVQTRLQVFLLLVALACVVTGRARERVAGRERDTARSFSRTIAHLVDAHDPPSDSESTASVSDHFFQWEGGRVSAAAAAADEQPNVSAPPPPQPSPPKPQSVQRPPTPPAAVGLTSRLHALVNGPIPTPA